MARQTTAFERQAFESLSELKKEILLAYYDMNKQTYIFTGAHVIGFWGYACPR